MQFLLLLLPLIYFPVFGNFFSGDDWFHLRITQINSLQDFLSFFSFSPGTHSAAFYRPLPTQVFFFTFQSLFGTNPLPYYIFTFFCFLLSILLIFFLSKELTKDKSKAIVATIIYAFSVSNFTRVYFLSAFQEISLVIFSLLFFLSHLKRRKYTIAFFLLALLSKETAVTLPFMLIATDLVRKEFKIKRYLAYLGLLLPYLFLRFTIFGLASGDSYLWNFSPVKAANTLMWYFLWCLGAPELLVDYIGSGLRPVAKLFTDLAVWWPFILYPLITLIGTVIAFFIMQIRKIDKNLFLYTLLFLIPLAPVVFLPEHKFSLELGLPLLGFSLAISWLVPKKGFLGIIFIVLYISYNIAMNFLTYPRHYSVNRGVISKKVFSYIKQKHPLYDNSHYFYFTNSESLSTVWGESKQISQSLSGQDFFKVYYHDSGVEAYYQDIQATVSSNLAPIYIESNQFLTK